MSGEIQHRTLDGVVTDMPRVAERSHRRYTVLTVRPVYGQPRQFKCYIGGVEWREAATFRPGQRIRLKGDLRPDGWLAVWRIARPLPYRAASDPEACAANRCSCREPPEKLSQISRAGHRLFWLRCRGCGANFRGSGAWIPKSEVQDPDDWPTVADALDDLRFEQQHDGSRRPLRCSRCGRTEDELGAPADLHDHHSAFRYRFGWDEANTFPRYELCRECHAYLHARMDHGSTSYVPPAAPKNGYGYGRAAAVRATQNELERLRRQHLNNPFGSTAQAMAERLDRVQDWLERKLPEMKETLTRASTWLPF